MGDSEVRWKNDIQDGSWRRRLWEWKSPYCLGQRCDLVLVVLVVLNFRGLPFDTQLLRRLDGYIFKYNHLDVWYDVLDKALDIQKASMYTCKWHCRIFRFTSIPECVSNLETSCWSGSSTFWHSVGRLLFLSVPLAWLIFLIMSVIYSYKNQNASKMERASVFRYK
jgi:hypothetical protein